MLLSYASLTTWIFYHLSLEYVDSTWANTTDTVLFLFTSGRVTSALSSVQGSGQYPWSQLWGVLLHSLQCVSFLSNFVSVCVALSSVRGVIQK